jgi:hypothetical protein
MSLMKSKQICALQHSMALMLTEGPCKLGTVLQFQLRHWSYRRLDGFPLQFVATGAGPRQKLPLQLRYSVDLR